VELWSVFRLSALALLALYVITLGAFALLWWIASNTGTVHNIEKFLRDVGFKNFHFDGPQLMGGVAAIGAVLVLAGSLLATVTAALFNVLSEMTGGVGVVVIEEEPIAAQPTAAGRSSAGIAGGNGGADGSPSAGSMSDGGTPTTSTKSAVGSRVAGSGSGDGSGSRAGGGGGGKSGSGGRAGGGRSAKSGSAGSGRNATKDRSGAAAPTRSRNGEATE
jgi:hypothetical protein